MTVAEVYRRAKRMLLGSLLPELCPSCGASSHAGFCDACRRAFVAVHDPCQRCGLARPVARCPADPSDWSLDAVVAPYLYCEPVSTLILDFKYRNRLSLGRAFGLLLADEVPPRGGFADRIVPVPLHRARLRERSFNQADEIATALARVLGIPLLTGGIQRHVATRSQT
jgi:predicted amidophosphoribosyltransferase